MPRTPMKSGTLVVDTTELKRAFDLIRIINNHDLSKIMLDQEYITGTELEDFRLTRLSNIELIKAKLHDNGQ